MHILVKYFGKNFIFRVKSTIFLFFRDQIYIFGYKTTVFILNLYICFWANEWISKYSDKIMSCKLWGKLTSVSVNINFGGNMSILCKKNWNFGRNVDFFIKCALLLKVIIFLQNVLIFKTMCQNLIKKFQFLRIC